MSGKPLPIMTDISRPFWDSLAQHKLTALHCSDCNKWTFYARRHCQHCFSHTVQWQEIESRATLYSYTIARIPTLPEFAEEAPQILAVVEFEQGIRMNTTLVGLSEDEIHIGMSLRGVFDTVAATGETLVRFTSLQSTKTHTAYQNPLEGLPRNDNGQIRIGLDNHAALFALVNLPFSDWSNELTVTQEVINEFAELSGDDYWIHTDPEKAKQQSPYGTTIAHGSLVQVLQSKLQIPLGFEITGFATMVNYGSNKLRFPAPVLSGQTVQARAKVKDVSPGPKGMQMILEVHIHVVGSERPSVINELVIFYR